MKVYCLNEKMAPGKGVVWPVLVKGGLSKCQLYLRSIVHALQA
jgi:hypothetical protein